jgi:hypothetical protein
MTNDNRCKYIGCIDSEDLENITDTLINSGLLTEIILFVNG